MSLTEEKTERRRIDGGIPALFVRFHSGVAHQGCKLVGSTVFGKGCCICSLFQQNSCLTSRIV